MIGRIGRVLIAAALITGLANPVVATVLIRTHGPDHVPDLGPETRKASLGVHPIGRPSQTKGTNTPDLWLIPLFRVDKTGFSDTTLWSVRNETGSNSQVDTGYFDTLNVQQAFTRHFLDPREVLSVNVRDVDPLTPNAQGVAIGFITIRTKNPSSIDTFQIDVSKDLATGQKAIQLSDFCTLWQARFIRFTPDDGSQFLLHINGPKGIGAGDPPSVVGTVYDEAGVQQSTFTIHTDQYVLPLSSLDLIPNILAAGVIEFRINATFAPAGYVSVGHQADGRFSAGLEAFCLSQL